MGRLHKFNLFTSGLIVLTFLVGGCGFKSKVTPPATSSTNSSVSAPPVTASPTPPPANMVTTTALTAGTLTNTTSSTTGKVLTFDLGTGIVGGSPSFPGAKFLVNVYQYQNASGGKNYVFYNPSLTTGTQAIHIASIHVVINGTPIVTATTFESVNRYVAAGLTNQNLSSGSMLIAQTPVSTDQIAFQFGDLSPTNFNPPTYTQLLSSMGTFGATCVSCHSSTNAQGGLDLTNYNGLFTLSPAFGIQDVIKYDPADSLVVQMMKNGMMPPGGGLTAAQIQSVVDWINNGAPNN